MTWYDIYKIIFTGLASVGVASGLIAICVKFSANLIAKRLQAKYELKLNKELEEHISNLDKKSYISKARFDKEFIIYQDLSEKVLDMVETNTALFPLLDRPPEKEDEKKEFYAKRHKDAASAYNIASKSIYANAPFIPEDIFDLYDDIRKKCLVQLNTYHIFGPLSSTARQSATNEFYNCFEKAEEIRKKSDKIISKVREYLASLDVNE
jgi:hypothetical protein